MIFFWHNRCGSTSAYLLAAQFMLLPVQCLSALQRALNVYCFRESSLVFQRESLIDSLSLGFRLELSPQFVRRATCLHHFHDFFSLEKVTHNRETRTPSVPGTFIKFITHEGLGFKTLTTRDGQYVSTISLHFNTNSAFYIYKSRTTESTQIIPIYLIHSQEQQKGRHNSPYNSTVFVQLRRVSVFPSPCFFG